MVALSRTQLALGLCLGLFLWACGGPEQATADPEEITPEQPKDSEVLSVGGLTFSVPSPVQAALAIKNSGQKYQRDLTIPLDRGNSLVGKLQQATLLGMLGADMAYVTVHNDGQRSLATLQAIERLGGKLDLGNAFDRSLLDRFKSNIGSEDSLLRFSGTAFRAADEYLKNNERDDVSALILAGGWIESMHLTLADPNAAKDAKLIQRIGEQKNTLDGLVELIGQSDKDKSAEALLKAFMELRTEFASITTTYVYEKPVTDVGSRTTYINSVSSVTVPAEKLASIASKVMAIRSMILA